jgi:ribosomal protein S18 acetylase RimI-like enzyme
LAVARVHVQCWQESYAGIIPAAMLAALSVQIRTTRWRHILNQPEQNDATVVHIAEQNGDVVGFGSCGLQRTEHLRAGGYDAEISALYVRRVFQRHGTGGALMCAMASDLAARGFRGVSLWVLRDNTAARRFYESYGGKLIGEREDAREDGALIEVAYGWRPLTTLQRREDMHAKI